MALPWTFPWKVAEASWPPAHIGRETFQRMSDGDPEIGGVPSNGPVRVESLLHAFGFLFGTRFVHDVMSDVP